MGKKKEVHFALVVHKKMARSRLVLRLLLRTAYQAFTNPFVLPKVPSYDPWSCLEIKAEPNMLHAPFATAVADFSFSVS